MRLESEPRNLRLPKLAAHSKKVRNAAQMLSDGGEAAVGLCVINVTSATCSR